MDGDIAIHNKHAEKRRIIAAVLLLTLLIACVNLFLSINMTKPHTAITAQVQL